MKTPLPLLLISILPLALRGADSDYFVAGSEVTFIASADGSPAPTFTWFKNGLPVPTDANVTVSADTSRLVIAKLDASHAGTYTVTATNIAGSATSLPVATLVAVPPSSTQLKVVAKKPSDVTVTVPPGTKVVYAK